MNKTQLSGRLTKDPDVRYSQGENPTAVARLTLAVDRRGRDAGTDFIPCVAFGHNAEFAEKYLRKGHKIIVCGRIQTGSYTNRDGQKIHTMDVAVDEFEFAESKRTNDQPSADGDGFMNIPDGIENEVPFQ